MSIFEHHRFEIYNQSQHPYKHDVSEFAYTTASLPGVTNVSSALDWITAVLYPTPKASVANPAALPAGGNTIGDYRVVTDDGDGKSAGYRWEQREGDAVAKWYKIYDMDFGAGSVLQQAMDNAQELFVLKWGNDDLDSSGVAVTGVYAGQVIYGGKTASKNLTLRANSGDGVGASTGYVQVDDNFRPALDNTYDAGTSALRFKNLFVGTQIISAAGSAGTPSRVFTGALTTGTYLAASNSMGFAANGATVGNYSSGGAWTLGAANSAQLHQINGRFTTFNYSAGSGNSGGILVQGTDASTSAPISVTIVSNGGDAVLQLQTANGTGTSYFVGKDSTSNNFVFGRGSSAIIGSSGDLTIDTGGLITLGVSGSTSQHIINGHFRVGDAIGNGINSITENHATSYAFYINQANTTNTANGFAIVVGQTTAAGGTSNAFAIYNAAGGSDGDKIFQVAGNGLITIGQSGGILTHLVYGNLAIATAGYGLKIKEGSNARMGTATMNGITEVTVSTTAATTNSRIFLCIQAPGGTPGAVYISSRSTGVSFGVKSTGAADISTVAWLIVDPA